MFSLESPLRNMKITLNYSKFAAIGFCSKVLKKELETAISVQAIEVLLYEITAQVLKQYKYSFHKKLGLRFATNYS